MQSLPRGSADGDAVGPGQKSRPVPGAEDVPAILIPLPTAADDHPIKNASTFLERDAALVADITDRIEQPVCAGSAARAITPRS